jgi:pectate lyase
LSALQALPALPAFPALPALLLGLAFLSAQAQPLLEEKPAGWASLSGGVTGGAGGPVTEVSTLAELQSLAKASGKQVILIKGRLGNGTSRVAVASDKTLFGLPGAVLAGGIDIKDVTNVIVRNLKVEGPGAVDVDGVDAVTVQECSRIWLDHLDVSDGQDGNMDITNGADLVTVSWTRFSYTSKSQNHQFCNLIGSSDSRTTDRGKLRVTMHHNWWAEGNKERMPRVRFGKVHVANNLFASPGANHCVRAGFEADILVEGNAFIGVGEPIDLFENDFKAVTQRNNIFTNTSGNTQGQGTAFTPDYTMALDAAKDVEARVKGQMDKVYGAGATLPDPRGGATTIRLVPMNGPAARRTAWSWGPGGTLTPEMLLGRRTEKQWR